MPMSAPGVGSGLPIKEMVEGIVKAKVTPDQVHHDKRLKKVETEISVIGQVKSALANLQSSLTKLADYASFYSMQYTTSDSSFFSVSLSAAAKQNSYQIKVDQLAQKETLASAYYPNNNSTIGSGNINILFGTYSNNNTTFTPNADINPVSITIDPSNNSLSAIANTINNAKVGVTASVIQDSQGSRLTLTSNTSGQDYAMQISGDITAINYDPTTNTTALTETLVGQNSIISVNGLVINQNSNTINNAMPGVTLNLLKAQVGTTITLNINKNQEQPTILINEFIKQYNDVMSLFHNLTAYNKQTKKAGYMQGDAQLRSLGTRLTQLATTPLNNKSDSSIQSLSDLGIKTNRQGQLELDQETYNKVLKNNFNDIGTLFAKSATSENSNILINSIGAKVPAGLYNVNLSEYTPGVSMSGTIGTYSASSTDGVTLTGSGKLKDLSLSIYASSIGDVGQITVTDGLASILDHFLDTYLSKDGNLTERTNHLNEALNELDEQQEKILKYTETLTIRYMKRFNTLDLLLAKLQSQNASLTQMINSMPQINQSRS